MQHLRARRVTCVRQLLRRLRVLHFTPRALMCTVSYGGSSDGTAQARYTQPMGVVLLAALSSATAAALAAQRQKSGACDALLLRVALRHGGGARADSGAGGARRGAARGATRRLPHGIGRR